MQASPAAPLPGSQSATLDVALASEANLPEAQRVLRHSRLSTTGIYLTPSEDDLRLAVNRAGV
jgi:hypothetical protein